MIRVVLFTVIAAFFLAFASGCSEQRVSMMNELEGSWVTRSVDPPEFQKRFGLACATFNADMTFDAVAHEGGQTIKSRGTYSYNPWQKELMLKTNDKELVYTAVVWWTRQLVIEKKMPDGAVVTTKMERGESCPPSEQDCAYCAQCPACQAKRRAAGEQ